MVIYNKKIFRHFILKEIYMKKRSIIHWEKNQYTKALLLFVQSFEESTFYYSYESYKMPALNSHYLCYDIRRTAGDINKKVLMDGNFIPLAEEFEKNLLEDPYIKSEIDEKGCILFNKDKKGQYYNLADCDLKTKIKYYPDIAEYICDICSANNSYINFIVHNVVSNVFLDFHTNSEFEMIYKLTRAYVTELVNSGYSKEYLYQTVIDFFYNEDKNIKCKKETLFNFFNKFTFEQYNFKVAFGVNKKAALVLKQMSSHQIKNASSKEKKLLNLQKEDDKLIVCNIEAFDSYSAYETAEQSMNSLVSLHRIHQHNSKLYVTNKAIVTRKIEGKNEKPELIQGSLNVLKKRGNSSYVEAYLNDVLLTDDIDLPSSFIRAISIHNGAIDSSDVSNQLLNLWTMVEILISTKRDDEDRINTICSILCAILNRSYIYSNIEQLLKDIFKCSDLDKDEVFNLTEFDDNLDEIEKFTLILSLEKYKDKLLKIHDSLSEYPLLQYRMTFYSKCVFKNSVSIFNYLNNHRNRIRWHVMRIYRNRNMIVHNGSYMPYRDSIVENLHFYIDALIDLLIEYYHLGIINHESIYRDILKDEAIHLSKLGKILDNDKKKVQEHEITEENALDLIFNGYSGNYVKKAINEAINQYAKNKTVNNSELEM